MNNRYHIFYLKDDSDRARTVLFTVSAAGNSTVGVIFDGKLPDQYSKPSDGYPFLKYDCMDSF